MYGRRNNYILFWILLQEITFSLDNVIPTCQVNNSSAILLIPRLIPYCIQNNSFDFCQKTLFLVYITNCKHFNKSFFFRSQNITQMTEKKPEIFKGGGSLKILLRTQKTFHRPLMSNNNIIHYIHNTRLYHFRHYL